MPALCFILNHHIQTIGPCALLQEGIRSWDFSYPVCQSSGVRNDLARTPSHGSGCPAGLLDDNYNRPLEKP